MFNFFSGYASRSSHDFYFSVLRYYAHVIYTMLIILTMTIYCWWNCSGVN